ncbi:MAG: hypothetical protein GY796_30115, partial [Chloroflexi bacterium]|nr:hypothetical protein [Chloroflexota bacterium]
MNWLHTSKMRWHIVLIVALFLFTAHISPARAAVDLIFFAANVEGNQIRLDWETATELDSVGFFVKRGTVPSADYENDYARISLVDVENGDDILFVPARGDIISGALYSFYDDADPQDGITYYYVLEDINSNNESEYHGLESATLGGTPTPTPTSTSTATSEMTATLTTTPTPTKTNTPSGQTPAPSTTPTPTRTRVPSANTPTPRPTATPT